jgi:hypothetical protein
MRATSIRSGHWGIVWSLVLIVSFLLVGASWAQTTDIMEIQESWELVVGTPSIASDAPQITCAMAPVGNIESVYATFMVNHQAEPSYTAGGLELQVWNGKTLLASKRFPNQAVLATPGETIRWTQVMRITNEGLVIEVINGTSTTWGAFGGDGTLKIIVPTTLTNLNGYNPAVSTERSDVSYAANRVSSLAMKSVRAYGATGLIAEDNTTRVVHSLAQ